MYKSKMLIIIIIFMMILINFNFNSQENKNLIQMAILLDTSGSMDGLIEQAKAQLWKIVNELA